MSGFNEDYHESGHPKEYFDYRGYPLDMAVRIVARCIKRRD